MGILGGGAQVSGGGQSFETIEDIDFSDPFNSKGEPNRLKIPNFDANNTPLSYTITKREAVVNGVTRIYKRVITDLDQKPFLKLYLPEQNVLGVVSVIHKDGTNFTTNPTSAEFLSTSEAANSFLADLLPHPSIVPEREYVFDPGETYGLYGV